MLTGGGTGGHAYPAIAIAEALRSAVGNESECELLYLGSKNSLEERLAHVAGIPFACVSSRKLSRRFSPQAGLVGVTLVRGLVEAMSLLRRFQPDIVIGTGGYVTAAVALAQAARRGYLLIHEQNVIPGRTNLWLSKFATRVCLTFDDSMRYFPAHKCVVTGLPIRSDLVRLPRKEVSRNSLGLSVDLFTILVLGGSQGAQALNNVVAGSVTELSKLPVQIYHQVGERNFEEINARREHAHWSHYHVRAYIDDMALAYSAADLVVGRSGASTVAEITCAGLPAIFVPYPYAYADHQRYNAEFVARRGGALVVLETEFTSEKLITLVQELLASPERLVGMGEASRSLG
ncbi:MAG: undecaprenyldiphospho-muramoylpentapeptide beta-N-acetylglucosaminyltransferase, partial [Armatimonadota bacterium]